MKRENLALRRRARTSFFAASLAVLVWSAGCKDDRITSYNAPKPANGTPAATPATAPAAQTPAAGPAQPRPAGPDGDRPFEAGGLKATIPAGWELDPRPRMMREATFTVGDPSKKTEVVITKLPGGPAGGLTENVNRWRGQVGLPPVAEVNEQSIRKVKIAGKDASVFDFAGPESAPTRRQIQAVIPADSGVYYVKIIGDAALVADQQSKFERFLTSIEFAK